MTMEFEPNPQDVDDFNWEAVLRQPGNHARLLAMLQQREQRARDSYDPRRELWSGGPEVRRSDVDFYLGQALPTMVGAASPSMFPATLGRIAGGLGALRRAYNSSNESVFGPAKNYGYYGPGQKTFDSATQRGDGLDFGTLFGLDPEPRGIRAEPHISGNLWDLLRSYQ